MFPILLITAAAALTPAATLKPTTWGNPLVEFNFCADPTAIEHEGRLYVYGTNDQQQYVHNGGQGNNGYGNIRTLVCLSTDDMVNWTYHGTIDMGSALPWMWASWAPSIVKREEADGLTHFYMYFSNGGSVGVATATSPLGPWRDPLGHVLVDAQTPGLGLCATPFDPGAVIDANGVGWLTLGGGSPNAAGSNLQPGNARIVRLGDDMVSLASDFVPIEAPFHFEANELNVFDSVYVYTYNTNWGNRDGWDGYLAAHGLPATTPAPSTCSMVYMTTTTPLDAASWTYRGEYLKNPGQFGYPWGNNHTHLQEYEGLNYLFYHTQSLEQERKQAGLQAADASGYRCIGVNAATVTWRTATDGTPYPSISAVTANNAGPAQLRKPNPFAQVEAETMRTSAGIATRNYGAAGNTVVTSVHVGDWTSVRNVDFGDGAATITARLHGRGTMAVYLDRLQGTPVARLEVNAASTFEAVTAQLDPAKVKGTHTVFFYFEDDGLEFDWWRCEAAASGLSAVRTDEASAATPCCDLLGRPLPAPSDGAPAATGMHVADGRVRLVR